MTRQWRRTQRRGGGWGWGVRGWQSEQRQLACRELHQRLRFRRRRRSICGRNDRKRQRAKSVSLSWQQKGTKHPSPSPQLKESDHFLTHQPQKWEVPLQRWTREEDSRTAPSACALSQCSFFVHSTLERNFEHVQNFWATIKTETIKIVDGRLWPNPGEKTLCRVHLANHRCKLRTDALYESSSICGKHNCFLCDKNNCDFAVIVGITRKWHVVGREAQKWSLRIHRYPTSSSEC